MGNRDEYSWMIEVQGRVVGNITINSIYDSTKKEGVRAGNLAILIGDPSFWGQGLLIGVVLICLVLLDLAEMF
jgi:RimJ/RimL family protein N-acetyltransferase